QRSLTVAVFRPTWVSILENVLVCVASLAVVLACVWLKFPGIVTFFFSAVPSIIYGIERRGRLERLPGLTLVACGEPTWLLGTFSEDLGLSQVRKVRVVRRHRHIFGLTLGLKLQDHPHNSSKVVNLTLWHRAVSDETLREVSALAASSIEQSRQAFERKTA
ncbi:MAG: hypothetical protein NTW89_07910, partial [Burkholderiales bacterium]|nr:hypothetical protein [Burkholderiales bacterium]